MSRFDTDICIIGAGAAGLSLAAGAVQMGARVTLIEAAEMGGDCLNHGCVPSKALLAAAALAQARREGAGLGLVPTQPLVDFAAVLAHVKAAIATIAPHDSEARFVGLGVQVMRGWARFVAPGAVEVGGRCVTARRFVIATGSRPVIPALPGLEGVPYLTNESVFDQPDLPDHLIVLGGGPIGLEMAQAHARLGAKVTVVEAVRILPREDPEAVAVLADRLRLEGVAIVEGTAAARVEGASGAISLHLADGRVVEGARLLLAVGRRPVLDDMGLEAAGIAHTAAGVTVDRGLRSPTNRRVYALGDAAGMGQFTHLAGYHAGVAARSILFGLTARAGAVIPRVTYTAPELAQIGLTEAEARARYGAVQVIRQEMGALDRVVAAGGAPGFLKLVLHRGRPVGVTIVGPQAGEVIGPWSLVLTGKLRLSALAGVVLPYPTVSEINKRAAGACFSPRLFANPWVKRVVRLVQRRLP